MINDNQQGPLRVVLLSLLAAAGVVLFFRDYFFSAGEWILGDVADGQLIQSIHEHWWRVFTGKAAWRDLEMFYPVRNSLGYSDTFFLQGLFQSVFRFLGLGTFHAYQWSYHVMAVVGFAGMFTYLQYFRKFRFWVSAPIALIFIIASPLFITVRNSHIQMLAVWWVPWILILLEMAWKDLSRENPRGFFSFTTLCLLSGLLTYSTFYITFFTILGILIGCGGWLLIGNTPSIREKLRPTRGKLLLLAPGLGILAVLGILFLWTYLPVLQETGGRSLAENLKSTAPPHFHFNRSLTNLLWGQFNSIFPPYEVSVQWTRELALPPITFLMALVVAIRLWAFSEFRNQTYFRVMAIIFGAIVLLMTDLGPLSLWQGVHYLLPGAEAIRVIFRLHIFLLVPALILIGFELDRLSRTGIGFRYMVAGWIALLTVEQLHTAQSHTLNQKEKTALAKAIPEPQGGDAFYAFGSPRDGWETDSPHNTAHFLAQTWDLPTLNGRSGFNAPNWPLYPMNPGVSFQEVPNWLIWNGALGMIHFLDLDSQKWVRRIDYAKVSLAQMDGVDLVEISPTTFASAAKEWQGPEIWGYWTGSKVASIELPQGSIPPGRGEIEISARPIMDLQVPENSITVRLNGNEVLRKKFNYQEDFAVLQATVEIPEGPLLLELEVEKTIVPIDLGIAEDGRTLGIAVKSLILRHTGETR